MQNKKILSTLIIAILTFSMIATLIPIASAIGVPTLTPDTGPVGKVVTVSGADATPGLMVEIYWDESLEPEKLLNTTRALGSGDYACEVTIPEATNGEHWIIAFDVTSSTSKGASFTVTPEITLTPTAGLPGDPVTVNGTGFAATSDIILLFYETLPGKVITGEAVGTATADVDEVFYVSNPPVVADSQTIYVAGTPWTEAATLVPDDMVPNYLFDDVTGKITFGTGDDDPAEGEAITADYTSNGIKSISAEFVGTGDGTTKVFLLKYSPVVADSGAITISITGEAVGTATADVDEVFYVSNPPVVADSQTIYVAGTPWTEAATLVPDDMVPNYLFDDVTGKITFGTGDDDPAEGEAITADYEQDISYTIDYDTGTITFGSAPGDGMKITADYEYYLTVTPAEGIETDALGSFTDSFVVPRQPYTTYFVTALDAKGNEPTAVEFKIGASITLTPEEGPTGIVITIVGRGFRGTAITTIEIVEIVKSYTVSITLVDEAFETELIFPSAVDMAVGSEYTISVSDDQGAPDTATATFTVTGLPKITVSPKYALPGDPITVEGVNFTQIEGTEVTLTLSNDGEHPVGITTTNATGGFKDTFTVPAVTYKTYTLTADDVNVTATTSFTVGMVYAVLSPAKGSTGTQVTATGSGFTAGPVNGTFNDILVFEDNVADDGTFSTTFTVPTVPVAVYTVTIMDEAGLTFEASFNVTETTTITVTPSAAPVGYTVTIEGLYFTAEKTVTITLKNATATWSKQLATTTTNKTGGFSCTFAVPTLDLGDYVINATAPDTYYDLFDTATFSVVKVYIEMHTRATEYLQGDTVSFYIKSTFPEAVTITLKDPTEYPYGSISITAEPWEALDGYYVVPYTNAVFTLPNDAVLGTWNWTATVGEETETGLFDVVEKPTLSMILDRLDELDVTLSGLITDSEGNVKAYIDTSLGPVLADLDDINAKIVDIDGTVATISTKLGEVKTSVDSIDAKIVSIQDGMVTINTTLGEVRTLMEALNLDAINAVITSLNQTIATISSDIGTIKVSIEDIGLKVVAIDGTVATIKTDLGTMQGTVTSIDDDVATIKTDVGTVKTDVSDIGVDVSDIAEKEVTVDLTAVWIAVVFSLLAFLAAIATIVMLRSKLA